ncbi:MAG: hypothetical protein M2R45_04539 [Verrucomicrobia subdivision 3 bacterium]|nr:hypothetical protein [Limisphaerales bacterium]MCS1416822.1 hypothetical protein [Limisphaerales bacterium]
MPVARQAIQNWIVESRAEFDASRLMVLQAGWKIDREGSETAWVDISTIKFSGANRLLPPDPRAIQMLDALRICDGLRRAATGRTKATNPLSLAECFGNTAPPRDLLVYCGFRRWAGGIGSAVATIVWRDKGLILC